MIKRILPIILAVSGCAYGGRETPCNTQVDSIPIEIKFEDGRNIDVELSERKSGDIKIWVDINVPRQWKGANLVEISLVDNDVKTMAVPMFVINNPEDNKDFAESMLFLSKSRLSGQFCIRVEYMEDSSKNGKFYSVFKRLVI